MQRETHSAYSHQKYNLSISRDEVADAGLHIRLLSLVTTTAPISHSCVIQDQQGSGYSIE